MEFWNPKSMKELEEEINNSFESLTLDLNNVLSSERQLAYLGGTKKKFEVGKITNPLREKTSSFQYVFGYGSKIREDGIQIEGPILELIPGLDIKSLYPTYDQILSLAAQLYYTLYLLAEKKYNCSLKGIVIRDVQEGSVPFFKGSIETRGVIPVIYSLELGETPYPESGIDLVENIFNVELKNKFWSPLYSLKLATYTSQEKPELANGKPKKDPEKLINHPIFSNACLIENDLVQQLEAGISVPFETITVLKYTPEGFLVRGGGKEFILSQEELTEYLQEVEHVNPFTTKFIPNMSITYLKNKPYYEYKGEYLPINGNLIPGNSPCNTLDY